MGAHRPAVFYEPVNFEPERVGLDPGDADYARYFLNLLHWKYVCWQADARGFVRLKYEYLTRVIPRATWLRVLARLTAIGSPGGPVVESDDHVVNGRKARGYRLTPGYRRVRAAVCRDETLNRRVGRLSRGQETRLLPVHRWLKAHLDRLSFDLDRALAIVRTLHPDPNETTITPDEYRLRLDGQCRRLAGGDRYLVCDQFGRVHTPVTSLPRELRCCLSVDGHPLVGLDLRNSQPLIAGLLARRFARSKDAAHRLRRAVFAEGGNPYRTQALGDAGGRDGLPPDLVAYLGCCERGEFYESFTDPGGSRERVKRAFMSVLMGPNRYGGPVKAAFEALYPTVARMLRDLKRKDHARAAWLLQNLEATIFIHRVCGGLMGERPAPPVFTVHDCLFTVPHRRAEVRAAVRGEFARLGVEPTLARC